MLMIATGVGDQVLLPLAWTSLEGKLFNDENMP